MRRYRRSGAIACLSLWLLGFSDLPRQRGDFPTHYVIVDLCDATELGSYFLHLVRSEVSRIFARAGVGVIWLDTRRSSYSISDKVFEARVYIREQLSKSFKLREKHLAHVPTDRGKSPGLVVFISRESVEKAIAFKRHTCPPVLARALGRVMAHELSHRFLRCRVHAPRGILKESFTRQELTQPVAQGFFFTETQARLLRVHARTFDDALAMLAADSTE